MKPKIKTKIKLKDSLNIDIVNELYEQHQKEVNKLSKEFNFIVQKEVNKFKMVGKILKHKNDIFCPDQNLIYDEVKLNTWFTIKESLPENCNFEQHNYTVEKKEEIKYK
jgi:hypothetical protein